MAKIEACKIWESQGDKESLPWGRNIYVVDLPIPILLPHQSRNRSHTDLANLQSMKKWSIVFGDSFGHRIVSKSMPLLSKATHTKWRLCRTHQTNIFIFHGTRLFHIVSGWTGLKMDLSWGNRHLVATFLFSNFPESWNATNLWRIFKKYRFVVDLYMARKWLGDGLRLGFVKFRNIYDLPTFGNLLNSICIGEVKLSGTRQTSLGGQTNNPDIETKPQILGFGLGLLLVWVGWILGIVICKE